MSEAAVVDAEVVDEAGTELEVHQDHSATLFRTDDPVQVLEKATRTADALAKVIKSRKLTSNIKGKEHVKVEGWQTLGSMLGVTPVCVWTRQIDNGWEARVEARTLDGRVVGAAEAMCLKSEGRWRSADDYAVRSMAQTRATSKALASPLRFVVTLAGYEGTPAEEMPSDPNPQPEVAPGEVVEKPFDKPRLLAACDRAGLNGEQKGRIGNFIGVTEDNDWSGVNPWRLQQCVEKLEAGDANGLSILIGGER